ncbi:Protein NETWORKED 1D [Glycine soja]
MATSLWIMDRAGYFSQIHFNTPKNKNATPSRAFSLSLLPLSRFKPLSPISTSSEPPRRSMRHRVVRCAAAESGDDEFTAKSGYLFELSVTKADSLGEYQIPKITVVCSRKPLLVARRLVQTSIAFGKWFSLRYIDTLLDRSESMFQDRECRVANGLDCFEYPAISCRKHSAVLTDFGGVGDGKTSNTKAFQYAISNLSHYASDGGALLVVPPGKWLTGSFNLTSHFTLFLQKEATILGSQDESEWPTLPVLPSYGRGRDAPDGQGDIIIQGLTILAPIDSPNTDGIDLGVPWTEEEHRTFPVGFEKLGKGDWRGISRNYVTSRTPTQVASHAHKYFIRLATMNKKKRRSSLFDMVGNDITNPISSSNCKSSKCEIEDDVTLSLVQLQDTKLDEHKDSDKYCEAGPAGAEHEVVPLWLHPQMKSSNNNVAAVVPDLELTLAVSKGKAKTLLGLEQTQTKSSPDSFLLGPISFYRAYRALAERYDHATGVIRQAHHATGYKPQLRSWRSSQKKNHLLESSLFNVNSELEGLRIKSKILEDSCLLFDHEKSSLTSDKEMLVSQLNITHQTLKDLGKKHTFGIEREEHSRIVQLNDCQLAEKELQIFVLQEDADYQKKEFEEELDRAAHAQMEIFILHKCIQGSEQKNFSLLVESQRLLESSKLSDRLVSKLENDNVQKQVDVNSLSEKIKILRIGLLQALKTLDVNSEPWCDGIIEEDQELLNHIHGKLQETQNSFQVAIENSVLVAFLGQLKLKAEKLLTERDSLDKELRTQSKQFLALQAEVQKILEKNQELKLTISKGEGKMEVMTTEIENLCKQLLDLKEDHQNIKEESCKTFEEKNSLMKRFWDLGEEKSKLEEEICIMIHDTIAQSNLSLLYQNIVLEKLQALKELSKDLDRLCSVNTDLEEKLKIMMGKLEDVQMENSDLKESLIVSSNELKLVQSVNDQLNCQIRNGKELLSQKENEILEAAKMFSTLHDEKTELQRLVEDLKSKYDGARVILEDQASQILKLSSDKDTQATTLYTRLQISAVNETLFEEKVRELADACEDLDRRSNFKGMESETLKERVNKLEGENGRLRGHLAAYVPAVSALNDCITSLEMQTLAHANPHNYKVLKVKDLMNHKYAESGPQTGEDQNAMATDALPGFQGLQKRISAIEMAVKQME